MSNEEIPDAELDGESGAKRIKVDEEAPGNVKCEVVGIPDESSQKISKRQMKKMQKREKWLQRKPEKRAKEKAKLKEKKLHAKLNNINLGPTVRELKNNTMEKSNCKIHVVIDLSFDDYMNSKGLSKCVKQILRCYSLNRRAKNPMQLHVTSFSGKSKEEMSKNTGYENWDLFFHEEDYLKVFKKEDITYLSSESENVITYLEDKVYVIGGLVDHNSQKGLCHRIAQDSNIHHGQLPIGEFLEMKTRKVLTIDHVFEILLGVSEGKTWKDAFLAVLPSRKGAVQKEDNSLQEDEGDVMQEEVNSVQEYGNSIQKDLEGAGQKGCAGILESVQEDIDDNKNKIDV
ncbi:hypothetical protein R5R35_012847 [Gryllus longicercus]|uniref:tRNA (guanine(9)-N(1))-methyltransferase n=1 Tax=Gryllus longicercus TaxID=2509291 RepID=A0AAN9YXH8_9ORTH